MIKIEDTETYGWEAAIHGMRNPLNSWSKSDSAVAVEIEEAETGHLYDIPKIGLGKNDYDLMRRLVKSGTDHAKFMRMIMVSADITAPRYWWAEYDTYKVGTVANSCSTMHTIHKKEFTLDDFSHEHLDESIKLELANASGETVEGLSVVMTAKSAMKTMICMLNVYRSEYLKTNDKKWWWQMIQLLPQSYNQKRTIMLNYQVLQNMYRARKNHKLDEWHTFCDWIESLPYSELITGKEIGHET